MRKLACLLFLLATLVFALADSITGAWTFNLDTPGGPRTVVPVFKLTGEEVTGTWDKSDVKGTFHNGALTLSFPLNSSEGGFSAIMKIDAKLDAGQLKGTWTFGEYGGSLVAKKND
ncbi:MAG TPA: hypothetical protein VNH18_30370 [Bryobacteraceae bacterium]|nr:hypothetical protein [Bryobacteraceae bacterium]